MPNKNKLDDILAQAEANGMCIERISMNDLTFQEGMEKIIEVVNEFEEHMVIPSSNKKKFCVVLPMCAISEEDQAEILDEMF